jgi:5-methylcytosine-specific restriction endonuclease McrA
MFKLVYNYFYPPIKRKAIPKRIKEAVWVKYNENRFIGKCYCCGRQIDKLNYHNAHVVSHKEGGLITVDNLRPSCMSCNLRMGKKNLYQFIKDNKLKGPGSKLLK